MKGVQNANLNGGYVLDLKGTYYEVFKIANSNSFKFTWEEINEIQLHGYRVSEISEKIAKELGLSKKDIKAAKICGLYHDIGKFCINPLILNKKERLNSEEFDIIKSHVIYSQEIMIKKGYYEYSNIVLYHHERLDGSGYYSLKEDQIPYVSKIIAIADVYDALSNDRSYRKAYKKETVLKILDQQKHKFDKDIYKAFTKLYGKI